MKKTYIIKQAFGESVLAKNNYGSYSMINVVGGLYFQGNDIKTFDSKEEAETYISEKELSQVVILEVYI